MTTEKQFNWGKIIKRSFRGMVAYFIITADSPYVEPFYSTGKWIYPSEYNQHFNLVGRYFNQ